MFASIFNRTLSVYVQVSQKLWEILENSSTLAWSWGKYVSLLPHDASLALNQHLSTNFSWSVYYYIHVFPYHCLQNIQHIKFLVVKAFLNKNQAAFALFLTFVHIYRYCNFCFQIPLPLRRCFIKINNQYLRSRPIYISHVNIQLGQFIQTDIKITWGIVSFKINHDFITLQIAQGSCLEFCWIGRAKIY